MKKITLKAWLMAGLLGSVALQGGCQNFGRKHTEEPPLSQTTAAKQKNTSRNTVVVQAPPPGKPNIPAFVVAEKLEKPTETTSAKRAVEAENIAETKPATKTDDVVLTSAKEESTRKPTVTDITALACFANAPDHSWLQGELLSYNNTWILRYASADVEDTHGGKVDLVKDPRLAGLKNGERVRVEGRVIPASNSSGRATYRIEKIEVLKKNNETTNTPY